MNKRHLPTIFICASSVLLAGCGGDSSVVEEREARRSPERILAKTVEILAPDAPDTVSVDNIRLEKSPRGKSLIVVWDAVGPQGVFRCNADQRVDFPVCDVVTASVESAGQPTP